MSAFNQSSVTATAAFIDQNTFSELESFLYGGPSAVTWFVSSVMKSNWFSVVPIVLRHNAGQPNFGLSNVSAVINRSADYVLNVWFRCRFPRLRLIQHATASLVEGSVRWVNNLMHNLFEQVQLTFNELEVQQFSSHWLDAHMIARMSASKLLAYKNLIGAVSPLTSPVQASAAGATLVGTLGTSASYSCILPFFFGEDSGLALPIAALPYNEVKINYKIRSIRELLMVEPGVTGGIVGATTYSLSDVTMVDDTGATNSQPAALIDPQTHAHYAVVHNDERVKMGDAPRDILIRQVQSVAPQPMGDIASASQKQYDLRFVQGIISLFWFCENTSLYDFNGGSQGRELSNYSTLSEIACLSSGPSSPVFSMMDPITQSMLMYENQARLVEGSDYFALIQPLLFSESAPQEITHIGFHMFTYALKPWSPLTPCGSTNYGRLSNVSITHQMSADAIANYAGVMTNGDIIRIGRVSNPTVATVSFPQRWRHVIMAQNWNIVRIANGSLGYPAL